MGEAGSRAWYCITKVVLVPRLRETPERARGAPGKRAAACPGARMCVAAAAVAVMRAVVRVEWRLPIRVGDQSHDAQTDTQC